ncbi:hypothetical protein ABZ403_03050 [Micromonospora zamorensis]|uniref:hypothetical protein n=1 Tax=Micromonospora zamorensis TaxID=709883 RepID=UPI00340CFC15
MNSILSTIGTKLVDRWLSLLALPGVLFIVAAVWGHRAGHRRALDLGVGRAIQDAGVPTALTAIFLAVAAVAVVYLARGSGALVRTIWLGRWRGPAAPIADAVVRCRRAAAARSAARRGVDPIAVYLPARATWMADRFRLAEARIAGQYHGLSLPVVWPRLWLLAPEETRAQIRTASSDFESTSMLTGWGLLYLALGALWYPAAVIGVVVMATGCRRGRGRAGVLAELVESAVDVHLPLVLAATGVAPDEKLTRDVAQRINDRFRKGV